MLFPLQASTTSQANSLPSTSAATSDNGDVVNESNVSVSGIDVSKLTLGPPVKYEVQNNPSHYRQYLRYQGGKLMLLTPAFEASQLTLRKTNSDVAVMVPIEPWVRQQLDQIERYVQQNVTIPSEYSLQLAAVGYKPLWQQPLMCISASRWCNVFQLNHVTGSYDSVDIKEATFGPGRYTVTIELPYLYLGKHRNGETFSITTRIVQIVHDPKPPVPVTIPFKPVEGKGRRKKKQPLPEAILA